MLILEKEYDLRTLDFNMNDNFTVFGCLNYFQDIARIHALKLNLGYEVSLEKNMFWILLKTKFEVYSKIKPETQVKIITWPSAKSRIDFTRDYEIRDLEENILIKGASQWVVIDKNTKKIVRSEDVDFPALFRNENFMKDKFEKIEIFELEFYDFSYRYKTVQSDLDHYMHVNNASYAKIIFDGLDAKYVHLLKSFEINYIKEVLIEKEIVIYYKIQNQEIMGLIVSENISRVTFKINF